MPVLTYGHQAVVRFVEETTPGTTPTDPALLLFSPETQRVRIALDTNLQESLDIGNPEVHEFYNAQETHEFEVEFHLYEVDKALDFAEQVAGLGPKAFTAELIPDAQAVTPHYFQGIGWKPSQVKFNASIGGAWVVTVTFDGGVWQDPVTDPAPYFGSGTRQLKSAISDPLRLFSSGAVLKDGAAWAILVGSLEVTFDHGVEAVYNAGDKAPVPGQATYDARKITGSADLSLDDGFATEWAATRGLTAGDIEVRFGGTGEPRLTLEDAVFPSFEGEIDVDTKVVQAGRDFNAVTYTEDVVP